MVIVRCNRWILIALLATTFTLVILLPALRDEAKASTNEEEQEILSILKELIQDGENDGIVVVADEEENDEESDSEVEKDENPKPIWRFDDEWTGEFEYRHSEIDKDSSQVALSRDASFSLGYQVNLHDNWDFGLALKSGRDKRPTTSWVTIKETDDQRFIYLKEYWLRYKAELAENQEIRVLGGSSNYPFDHNQLVIDSDVHRPTLGLEYRVDPKVGALERITLSAVTMKLLETKEYTDGNAYLNNVQLGARFDFDEQTRMESSVSYHEIAGANNIQLAVLNSDWRVGGQPGQGETTNYTLNGAELASNYRIVDAWFDLELLREEDWPINLEFEWARNTAASEFSQGRDTAYFAAVSLGRNDDPGDIRFGVEHAYLEPDSVLAALNRGGYATNFQGTKIDLRFVPAENLEWRLTHQWSRDIFDDAPLGAFDEDELRFYVSYSW